ncbi:MAG: hypothetical protein NTW32_19530 [Chloroflexi bacterium]|nr:hypothetical protein [Chloroflexota bacterium]
MEKYAELISILLQHSQRFLDFWNIQILVSVAVLGFVFSNLEIVTKRPVRIMISLVFLFMATFSIFSLSAHQQREERLYAALEYHVATTPAEFTPADRAYLESLKPTPFGIKAGALALADAMLIAMVWYSPRVKS